MVFTWVVTGEISGGDIRDRFWVYAYDLHRISLRKSEEADRSLYLPSPSFIR